METAHPKPKTDPSQLQATGAGATRGGATGVQGRPDHPTPTDAVAPADTTAPLSLLMEDIVFQVGGNVILKGVSFAVRPQEIVCLLGPSGCGKTSLLRIAAGIARQSAGTVHVAGRLVAGGDTFMPAETRPLGLVFQDLALFPHMRVLDNVAFGLRGGRDARARAAEALDSLGLAGHARAYPHQLSGGEQQRVALARALLPAPEVVLFDEPFSGLDRGLREAVREDTVRLLKERAATAVIVTHDPEEALAIADRIALMRRGEIVQVARPEEIWRAPVDLEAAQVFSHVNVFNGRAQDDVIVTALGPIPAPGALSGADYTVALRPDALALVADGSPGGVAVTLGERRFFGSHVEVRAHLADDSVLVRARPSELPAVDKAHLVPDLNEAIILPVRQLA